MRTELRRKFNELETFHILHFILSILTGIWVFVWIWFAMSNQSKRIELLLEAIEERIEEYPQNQPYLTDTYGNGLW